MVDTKSDPPNIEDEIPANDDETKSIEVILGALCQAINEGIQEGKAERVDKEGAEGSEEVPRRERRSRAKKETAVDAQESKEVAAAAATTTADESASSEAVSE